MRQSFLYIFTFVVLAGFIGQTINNALGQNAEFEQVEDENDSEQENEIDQQLDHYIFSIHHDILHPSILKSALPKSIILESSLLISGPLSPPPERLIG